MIVFILVIAVPLTTLSAITVANGEIDDTVVTIEHHGSRTIWMGYDKLNVIKIDVESSYLQVELFGMTALQHDSWNNGNYKPKSFIFHEEVNEKFVILNQDVNYVVIYNNNTVDVSIHFIHVGMVKNLGIASFTLGSLCALFVLILLVHTLGYLLRVLIIIPITGGNNNSSVSNKDITKYTGDRDKREHREYYYSTEKEKITKEDTSSKEKIDDKIQTNAVAKNRQLIAKPTEKVVQTTQTNYNIPAIVNISDNFIVAKPSKRYNLKFNILSKIHYKIDQITLPEMILLAIAAFFFFLGIFTQTLWNALIMPILIIMVVIIVLQVGITRRERVLSIVQGYGAIYVKDLAGLLNISYKTAIKDVWHIINKGLGNIAFDPMNQVAFVPGVENSEKARKVKAALNTKMVKGNNAKIITSYVNKPSSPTIYSSSISDVTEKVNATSADTNLQDTVIICPFCEAENPSDSSFCIKCGASLKPAK